MESVIKWRTGEPKEDGIYLVTDFANQIFFVDRCDDSWVIYDDDEILAWCPLNEIEPYKE